MSTVSTHVLDASAGVPATGVDVRLYRNVDAGQDDLLASGSTDADGRIARLGEGLLAPGTYRLVFDTGAYFARRQTPAFYPEVAVTFSVDAAGRHFHVPLLLSPFAYSTYRGS